MIGGASIHATLRARILDGTLRPGERLREIPLAEEFGVSRTPVREALMRLESDGLARRDGRSLVVHAVSTEELIQVYDLRIQLEGEAAAQAADRRTTVDIASLEALWERDRGLVDPDDAERTATNLEFHRALWRCTHNGVLQDLLGRLNAHLVHAPRSTLSVGDRWDEALDEHHQMIVAITERDAATAREVAEQHMTTARNLRLQLIREQLIQP
ncbi:GntR family transcriptional regulator [Mycolicibacterium vaccae]|uniref:GntR family transcriptional regulator n=1 Tax=Mycolicibacterium vaccae TaxID=1810 RepID=UPI003D089D93